MRIAFAGTPEFAAAALRSLIDEGHDVVLVLTQPDRPAGRGMKLVPSPVKQLAIEHDIFVYQPVSLKSPESIEAVAAAHIDVMVVAAYGLILPPAVLALPKFGCINIHASLLPRWRGAAPIQRTILAGDRNTGVCIMQMEAGLDTGPVLLSQMIPIGEHDTGGILHAKLQQLGAGMIVQALAKLVKGQITAVPQSLEAITYAEKVRKEEAEIDWSQSATVIERKVRAFNPSPVAWTRFRGETLRIWGARAISGDREIPVGRVTLDGTAAGAGVIVSCGEGALAVTELQKAGGKRLGVAAFLAGHTIMNGEMFGS